MSLHFVRNKRISSKCPRLEIHGETCVVMDVVSYVNTRMEFPNPSQGLVTSSRAK